MITIDVNVDELTRAITREVQALAKFPEDMSEELVAWQREDMRRQSPNVTDTADSASTDIWPRSRLSQNLTRQQRRGFRRRPRAVRAPGTGVPFSTRPILRPELFDQLEDRMDNLMVEKLGWP